MVLRRTALMAAVLLVPAVSAALLAMASSHGLQQNEASRANEPEKPTRPWHITFEELTHNDATGEGEATGVVATSDQDTVIKADRFTWNDKAKTARATGHLHMSDDRTEGTADQVDIDYRRDRRVMVLTGNVKLTLKPKKSPAAGDKTQAQPATDGAGPTGESGQKPQEAERRSDSQEDVTAGLRDYPIDVTCDRVEYEYARDKRHAVLTGSFKAVQKLKDYTRTLTAERAEWFGLDERVVLKGPVKLEDTKGRKGETPEDVEVFTREGKEGIKLRKGTYTMPVEEGTETPPERPAKPGTPPSSGGTP